MLTFTEPRLVPRALKIQKLSLELELARHNAEKWEGTREQRKHKYDSRNIVGLPSYVSLRPMTGVVEQAHQERPCSPEVHSQQAQKDRC